jgi:hypothetical protein
MSRPRPKFASRFGQSIDELAELDLPATRKVAYFEILALQPNNEPFPPLNCRSPLRTTALTPSALTITTRM